VYPKTPTEVFSEELYCDLISITSREEAHSFLTQHPFLRFAYYRQPDVPGLQMGEYETVDSYCDFMVRAVEQHNDFRRYEVLLQRETLAPSPEWHEEMLQIYKKYFPILGTKSASYRTLPEMRNHLFEQYAYAVCKDRPCFHISLIRDVSPNCDCHSENDIPIIPDVGMLASFDPVALDMACVDLANQQTALPGSVLAEKILHSSGEDPDHEFFHVNHPDAEWRTCLEHGEKIGLGTRTYKLVTI